MMHADVEYLQGLGVGLANLRASGQFCDAMVCVGSTRILVHKVVLSAASKTLHDLALDFDMMSHRERDQLEIVIPPDISLYAVNMFVNFIYTGQLELNSRIVGHMERLGTLFGISRVLIQCREFIQRSTTPDSQNLNLQTTEADSSLNGAMPVGSEHRLSGTPDASSHLTELSRSNSACSGFSADMGTGFGMANVKTEPAHFASYESEHQLKATADGQDRNGQDKTNMSMLEKLMSPRVNLKKLPSNITPDVVVMVSDDEGEEGEVVGKTPGQYTLEEKEAVAVEAKRYGTTQVSRSRNIPLQDILSWMTLFGLRHPGGLQKVDRRGKQPDHHADLALVRWIVQQQELNGCVDLNSMKQYALTVHKETNPKFCASKTWLGNFLQRNMAVLQGTKFVQGDKMEVNLYEAGDSDSDGVIVKQEIVAEVDEHGNIVRNNMTDNVLENLGSGAVLENVPMTEQNMLNEAVLSGFGGDSFDNGDDDDDNDADFASQSIQSMENSNDFTNSYLMNKTAPMSSETDFGQRTQGSVVTPFGKRPIIVGQSKTFDPKTERKIVQWVLERNSRDGYVFTDDFKDYARSLYIGSKPFGATQCWMKKFLRRNRALKDVKFCSKYKNQYTSEDKQTSVTLAKRFGVSFASKKTGINQKIIHSWKLSAEKGLLNVDSVMPSIPDDLLPSAIPGSIDSPSTSVSMPNNLTPNQIETKNQACHGIVPEFEDQIVAEIKDLQDREGSVNYNDISRISQSIYKETRSTFKASYGWVKTFLERRKDDLSGIELENVTKVLVEDESEENAQDMSKEQVSAMVDQALRAIDDTSSFETLSGTTVIGESEIGKVKRPIIVGPSVMFDRKTEKRLVEWALEEQEKNDYVFTDDFKVFAKSLHTGPKHFSASSGWMSLFLRRHRELKHVKWKSKFKNMYTEEEKRAAVLEAKRLGTGHVGRKLGIDPALICAWRIKMDRVAPKHQTFWKGTKLKKFGKPMLKFKPVANAPTVPALTEAFRGVVPEFEQRIIDLIHEEHEKEGSISYEEMSSISQSVYKETRPSFKASYAWIRNFMKRNEGKLKDLNIDNVKKVFLPEDGEEETIGVNQQTSFQQDPELDDSQLCKLFNQKRPIIVGQSRAFDTKTEKKLVQWVVEQQQKNGYVFLDQFKAFAQSLYKGEKKFAATQAWRIKFLRRNHAALKHVRFTSSFRNQYTLEEKKVIVQEAKKFGVAHVSKKTGIEHTLINQWKIKLERAGIIPKDTESSPVVPSSPSQKSPVLLSALKSPVGSNVGPGLYSTRGIVPAMENKINQMINNKMDEEGSVTYQFVSMAARAVYKETRPQFKASYNWVKDFLKRNKKALRHVDFESTGKSDVGKGELDVEILVPGDTVGNAEDYFYEEFSQDADDSFGNFGEDSMHSAVSHEEMETDEPSVGRDPMIVIENAESGIESQRERSLEGESNPALDKISQTKRPIIIGKAKHFSRKEEKKIVEWLIETQEREGYVFTDDFRRYARTLYIGQPGKFGATNAWITKFLRRNRLENKIKFQSKLVGNNPKYEERIIELILEQQEKEGSVSNDDIQKITMSVYKEIRPNFRACYNWIRDFIKRHRSSLADVELENVKKVYIPDDNEKDGVLIRDYDPSMNLSILDSYSEASRTSFVGDGNASFEEANMNDSSWVDLDSSHDLDNSRLSFNSPSTSQSSGNILDKLANQKRPIIIAPPKMMDIKTEKKIVQWMIEQQEQQGCVYLDLFKQYAKSLHTGPKRFAATQAWMTRFKQRNHAALKNVIIKSRFRNEYSVEEKLAIVEEAKRLGCNHVGRKLGINGGVIYSWKQQLEQAEKMGTPVKLTDSLDAGDMDSSRGVVPEFEMAIVNMVLETQRAKGSVSNDDISMCARSVYKETRPHFKASYNWVLDFIRKYKDHFKEVVFENKKRIISEEEKLHILSEEKKYGTEHVTKKRNIAPSTLSNWRKQMREKAIPIPKFKAIVSSKIKKKYAKKQLKSYSPEEKRRMVAVCEQNGVTYASLKLGVSRGMLTKWIRYFRDEGENIVMNATHASTAKKELEQNIVDWILEENEKLGIVLTNRVKDKAKKVFEEAYTNYNATTYWLESFLSANRKKFEHVRFRDDGDRDLEFSDSIKLKIARYAEVHGGPTTADLTGLLPKTIYHWRRLMKGQGHDLKADPTELSPVTTTSVKTEAAETEFASEPKSLMQQKLDRVAAKYDQKTRQAIVTEASIHGTTAIAAKHKIPLPLLLKWMKSTISGASPSSTQSRSSSFSSDEPIHSPKHEKLTIRLPSVEKSQYSKHSKEFKKTAVEEVKKHGISAVSEKYGIGKSTLYYWTKDERESSTESSRESVERKRSISSSSRKSLENENKTSTPLALKDIKKEPDTTDESISESSLGTPLQKVMSDIGSSRIMRRYSDEQKIEVAKRAHEFGCRETAQEMNIPLTNVTRWKETYKKAALKLIRGGSRSPRQLSTSSISSPTSSTSSSSSLKRKANDVDLTSLGYKRAKFSEEERIGFVKESEKGNIQAVADKAGVSIDSLYKWRSKYLPGIRLAAATEARKSPDDGRESSPAMPAPRNKFGLVEEPVSSGNNDPTDETDGFEDPENIVARLTDDDLAQIEVNTRVSAEKSVEHVIDTNSFSARGLVELGTSTTGSPHAQPIDDFDIMAADQLMEMTSSYMDAEKEQEQEHRKVAERKEAETIDLELVASKDNDQRATGEPLVPGKTSKSLGLGNIQIVNVKSEAQS
ncbi:uncharacterized protein LOC128243298 isoform X2 [Mya arenaria]|nr:uncharacterized protein LOC128243298 isoform X2 [Mya arenaria]